MQGPTRRRWVRLSLFAATLAALPALPVRAAQQVARPVDKTLSPYFVVKGARPGVDTLPLRASTAEVDIAGVIARVRVTQLYRNEGREPLEAIYVFPGSTRAAVFGMRMKVGQRTIVAKIERREQARRLYEAAKQAGKTASLLEQQRPNVFQMNVANILPGDEIRVELDYTELLVPEGGIYQLVYPAVVGPRYTEETASTAASRDHFCAMPCQRKGERPSYRWDIAVRIAAGLPVRELRSPSHAIRVRKERDGRAQVALKGNAEGRTGGDRDFVLRYSLRGPSLAAGLVLYPGGGSDRQSRATSDGGWKPADERFFLLMVQPPKAIARRTMPPREYVFILDVSGSMRGFPLQTAKKLLERLLADLRPQDRFNIMTFSGGNRVMSPRSLGATTANKREAMAMMARISGGGSTRLLPALKKALEMPASPRMSRSFVVVTDGYVMVEDEAFALIRRNLGAANLWAFGIGSSVNRHLIEGMARAGMGQPFVVLDPREAEVQGRKLARYIGNPVLSRVRVDFDGFEAYDVEPAAVPDVFGERPVVVFGKYRGQARGTVVVSGWTGRGRVERRLEVSAFPARGEHIALRYLWARHRIATLSDLNRRAKSPQRVEEITLLGLRYNLMTATTSFVAIDERVRNRQAQQGKGPTTVKQPLPLPRGVEESAVGARASSAAPMRHARRPATMAGGALPRAEADEMREQLSPAMAPRRRDKKSAGKKSVKSLYGLGASPLADRNARRRAETAPVKLVGLRLTGAREAATVRVALERLLPRMKRCARDARGAGEASRGNITLVLHVAANGKLVGISGLAKLPPALRRCLRRQLQKLRLAPAAGDTRARVTLRLH